MFINVCLFQTYLRNPLKKNLNLNEKKRERKENRNRREKDLAQLGLKSYNFGLERSMYTQSVKR